MAAVLFNRNLLVFYIYY